MKSFVRQWIWMGVGFYILRSLVALSEAKIMAGVFIGKQILTDCEGRNFSNNSEPKRAGSVEELQSCDGQLLGERARGQLWRNSAAAAGVLQETWLQDVPENPFPTPAPELLPWQLGSCLGRARRAIPPRYFTHGDALPRAAQPEHDGRLLLVPASWNWHRAAQTQSQMPKAFLMTY